MLFDVREVLIYSVVAGLLAAGALAVWRWSRRPSRSVLAGVTTALAFAAWNFTLNATDARGFNVDAPIIPLSWADAGSGLMVFAATALVLGLITERAQPAGRVVGAAAIAGFM